MLLFYILTKYSGYYPFLKLDINSWDFDEYLKKEEYLIYSFPIRMQHKDKVREKMYKDILPNNFLEANAILLYYILIINKDKYIKDDIYIIK
jgi:hypothetical protein